jgi:hypothetical protein
MAQQADINERMRSILVDWLVDVHLKFKLRTETLFLTVHIIDRYLAKEQTTRNKLQLVGCTAMLIAAKYEEIYAPEVRDFVYISDKVRSGCVTTPRHGDRMDRVFVGVHARGDHRNGGQDLKRVGLGPQWSDRMQFSRTILFGRPARRDNKVNGAVPDGAVPAGVQERSAPAL